MKYIFVALFSFALLSGSASAWTMYDATGFSGKPDLSKNGLLSIWIAYEDKTLVSGSDADLHTKFAQAAIAHPNMPWVLDVESLPIISGGAVNKTNVLRLLHVLQIAKSESKGQPVSYFGVLPSYTNAFNTDPNIAALSAAMDFFAPSLYSKTTWTKDYWANNYVAGAVIGVRSLNPNKPVYPFIWMYDNDSGPILGNVAVDSTFWLFMLDTIKKNFTGAIIWGGYDMTSAHPLSSPIKWDDNAPWWGVTKNFFPAANPPNNIRIETSSQ